MNKQDYAPDFGALGKTPLPIELGGTFADTAQQALINLGVAGMYGLDVADGMAKSTPQNFVNPVNVPIKYLYGVSEDGQVLVVGNKNGSDYSDKVDSDEGAAFVYVRQGKSWVLHKRFYNPTKETSAVFGYSVDVTRDGTQMVVGAYGEDHPVPEGTDLGSIYFYA